MKENTEYRVIGLIVSEKIIIKLYCILKQHLFHLIKLIKLELCNLLAHLEST